MPALCFYFQVHQPFRLRRYRRQSVGYDHQYFDEAKNRAIFSKVAEKCYLPANRLLLDLIRHHEGRFRVAFSLSGTVIEQMLLYGPEVLASFQELAATGSVEFLGETFYHSLSALHDPVEFFDQVELHRQAVQKYFNQSPRVFRNTELIYNDEIGRQVAALGFQAVCAEGADDILGWRTPHFITEHPHENLKILTKSYRLADDIAFRFSNRGWPEWPLTAEKYAGWIHHLNGAGELVNLFMDYETFGEHQWEDTGIFQFMRRLPTEILKHPDNCFVTPSEAVERLPSHGPLSFSRLVSWADLERDVTAWLGNSMQNKAFQAVHEMGPEIRSRNNPELLETWRRLLTSDHLYYMCTKWFSDGDVHTYFSPYKSPYEAFLTFMNVITDIKLHIIPVVASPPKIF
ncbi:MAG: alpha-amylase [Bdellovibrio sp.]|nr:MAG: alpha-amylase [Bdellovibrio sp.]